MELQIKLLLRSKPLNITGSLFKKNVHTSFLWPQVIVRVKREPGLVTTVMRLLRAKGQKGELILFKSVNLFSLFSIPEVYRRFRFLVVPLQNHELFRVLNMRNISRSNDLVVVKTAWYYCIPGLKSQSTHRVAMATFWRTFLHDRTINPAW